MTNPLDGQQPTPIPDVLPTPEPIPDPVPTPEYLLDQVFDDTFTEYGLRGPDGTISWGMFSGSSLATAADRAQTLLRLRVTATELSQPTEAFVNGYSWVGRVVHQVVQRSYVDAGELPIDSEAVSAPPQQ